MSVAATVGVEARASGTGAISSPAVGTQEAATNNSGAVIIVRFWEIPSTMESPRPNDQGPAVIILGKDQVNSVVPSLAYTG